MFGRLCEGCGCVVGDLATHIAWHRNLTAITRAVFAPDATDEEWGKLLEQAQALSVLQEIEIEADIEAMMTPEQKALHDLLKELAEKDPPE